MSQKQKKVQKKKTKAPRLGRRVCIVLLWFVGNLFCIH